MPAGRSNPTCRRCRGWSKRRGGRSRRKTLRVSAAGRTDAGVHALGQVVGLATESRLPTGDLQRGLNAVLPDDVAVVHVEEARDGFHATHDAEAKTVSLPDSQRPHADGFQRHWTWHYPQPLDAAAMHRAGQRWWADTTFRASNRPAPSGRRPVRTITELCRRARHRRTGRPHDDRSHRRRISCTTWSGRLSARW